MSKRRCIIITTVFTLRGPIGTSIRPLIFDYTLKEEASKAVPDHLHDEMPTSTRWHKSVSRVITTLESTKDEKHS